MRDTLTIVPVLLSGLFLATTAHVASAHCCHDDRTLGIEEQSSFRRGLHGLGDRSLGEEEESPTIDQGIDRGTQPMNNGGGFGQMQGNGIGNYGAGSLGERGPGGLGAMTGESMHRPPLRRR
jgi:hypothetical protein